MNDHEVAKALGHPLRLRILDRLGREEASSSELAVRLGVPPNLINYHLGILDKAGLVKVIRHEKGRGSPKRIFALAFLSMEWGSEEERALQNPESTEGAALATPLHSFMAEVVAVLDGGSFDEDAWVRSRSMTLDSQGRTEAMTVIQAASLKLTVVQEQSDERRKLNQDKETQRFVRLFAIAT